MQRSIEQHTVFFRIYSERKGNRSVEHEVQRDYVNFGTKNEITDEGRLIAAVNLLIRESVFTFKELQFECAMKVRAIIPNDWQEVAFV